MIKAMTKVVKDLTPLLEKRRKDADDFLATYDPSSFNDFSILEFKTGGFSHCDPFPNRDYREWRYVIYLSDSEVEDIVTIVHEITEWSIGLVIEKMLSLKKPIYLQRLQENRFQVYGIKQTYNLEHVLTVFSEICLGNVTYEKLREYLAEEDIESWCTEELTRYQR